jgi:hypothetical protein
VDRWKKIYSRIEQNKRGEKNGKKGDSGASTGSTGVHRGDFLPPFSPPVFLILAASTPSESIFDGVSKAFLSNRFRTIVVDRHIFPAQLLLLPISAQLLFFATRKRAPINP